MRTLLAQLIAKEEGFFRSGTLPARLHNPGDLRHSPHSQHPGAPDDIGTIDTDEHGWQDLERQLLIDARRGFTLRQAIYTWAPAADGNQPEKYLADVLDGFRRAGHPIWPETRLTDVLMFPAA